MTPTYRYDKDSHSLRADQPILPASDPIRDLLPVMVVTDKDKFLVEYGEPEAIIPKIKGYIAEGYRVETMSVAEYDRREWKWRPPRTFTLEEVLEIWEAAERIGVQCYTECKSSQPSKQQYFKTRFNVEL